MLVTTGTLSFPSFAGDGPQSAGQAVNFARPVVATMPLLAGFDVQFTNGDHHLHLLEVDLDTRSLSSVSTEISGRFGLRDHSGDWDDGYTGTMRYAVIGVEAGEQALGGTLTFPARAGSGPRTLSETIRFTTPAIEAHAAMMTGFLARFSREDHHLLQLENELITFVPSTEQLLVDGTYGLRDSSGSWDDAYDGQIRYAALGSQAENGRRPQIRTGQFEFPPVSGEGPRELSTQVTFANPIGNAAAALSGFSISYDRNDHHLLRANVEVEARKLSDTVVEVVGRFGLRDSSGDWDDAYTGVVQFAVIGE